MPQYLTPGVYIEEVPGAKPIEGVGTATGAFVGLAEKGPIGEPVLVTNWTQFVENFGNFVPYSYLSYAVSQFFAEGGTRCYVVRTCHYDYSKTPVEKTAATGSITIKDSAGVADAVTIVGLNEGTWTNDIWVEIGEAKKDPLNKFRLVVMYKGKALEYYEELTLKDVDQKINGVSKYIKIDEVKNRDTLPKKSHLEIEDRGSPAQKTLQVLALDRGLTLAISDWETEKFAVTILKDKSLMEEFDDLSMDDVERKINGTSNYIKVQNLKSTNKAPKNRPKAISKDWKDQDATPKPALRVIPLDNNLKVKTEAGTDPDTFKLIITQGTSEVGNYDKLTLDDVEQTINGKSKYIWVVKLESKKKVPEYKEESFDPLTSLNFFALTGGKDGDQKETLQDADGKDTLIVGAYRAGLTTVEIRLLTDPAKFKLVVKFGEGKIEVEVFDNLTIDTVANIKSDYIEVKRVGTNKRPKEDKTIKFDFLKQLVYMDYIGDEANANGLHAFDTVDDINIVVLPECAGDREVTIGAYTYCQNRRDCFLVADSLFGLKPLEVLAYKEGTGVYAGNAFNSSYGALYYPWISVMDPLNGGKKYVPPSGAMAGTYSATDVLRGVHKAPAGVIDGYLNSAVGVERLITKGEQELLNPEGINAIRSFPGAGIVIWGARTLSADAEWKYINVRRLLLYIEESIEEGTQWVVFEPNSPSLWASVKRDVTNFLTVVWREGALFGLTREEAFFVKIDAENNPPETRDLGRLYIDVGVAPVKPAEFVIIRISQKTLEA